MPRHKSAATLVWFCVALAVHLPCVVGGPPQPGSNCLRECGGVSIPYPFGIGSECAMRGFELTCNATEEGMKPFRGNVEILNVSLAQGQVRVLNPISSSCYNYTSKNMTNNRWRLRFSSTDPYMFSDTNKFTVIGCRALAYIQDDNLQEKFKYTSGCVAMWEGGELTNGSCSGIGCCQTAIPKKMKSYRVKFDGGFNTKEIYNVSPCSYAVLMDPSSFNFSPSYATLPGLNSTYGWRAPLVLDWAIRNDSACEAARNKPDSYTCVSKNSECVNSTNGPGYICNCSKGFQGNPYLRGSEGCTDIDECKDIKPYPCSVGATCTNIPGGFKCHCPEGSNSDAKNGTCERSYPSLGAKLGVGTSGVVLSGLIGFLAIEVIWHKRRIKRQALIRQSDVYFQQHGVEILSEMMAVERGVTFTVYNREEVEVATNGFDKANILGEGGQGTVYKAVLHDTAVAIKRCKEVDESMRKDFVQELVILSRVDHPNIVKLLGCCLQFEAPILVYELVQNRTLQELLHSRSQKCRFTLGARLRIAAQSAGALAYLHALPHPILHGDVKPANILLGDGWAAKVSDFGCSTIDEKTQEVPKGTVGYLDPDYLLEYQLTDMNDVYSFGVLLMELLTGMKPLCKLRRNLSLMFQEAMGNGTLHELLDREIDDDEASMGVVRQVAELACRCTLIPGTRRPAMRGVAEDLGRSLADHVRVHKWPGQQLPLLPECLTFTDMGSTTSSGYTESETTGTGYGLDKRAALSIEFAR